jgi:hypothetical protein
MPDHLRSQAELSGELLQIGTQRAVAGDVIFNASFGARPKPCEDAQAERVIFLLLHSPDRQYPEHSVFVSCCLRRAKRLSIDPIGNHLNRRRIVRLRQAPQTLRICHHTNRVAQNGSPHGLKYAMNPTDRRLEAWHIATA